MAARAQRTNDTPLTVSLPPWTKVVGALISILGAIIVWEAARIVNKVDDLSTRVAVLEERIPQPIGKEIAPMIDEVRKLALEVAELRGQLGKPSDSVSD